MYLFLSFRYPLSCCYCSIIVFLFLSASHALTLLHPPLQSDSDSVNRRTQDAGIASSNPLPGSTDARHDFPYFPPFHIQLFLYSPSFLPYCAPIPPVDLLCSRFQNSHPHLCSGLRMLLLLLIYQILFCPFVCIYLLLPTLHSAFPSRGPRRSRPPKMHICTMMLVVWHTSTSALVLGVLYAGDGLTIVLDDSE